MVVYQIANRPYFPLNHRTIFIAIAFFGIALSCQSKKKQYPNTFSYNQSVGIASLDPAFAKDLAMTWASSHIYEGLFYLDSHADVQPLLIDSYTIDASRCNYTFQLKKNIYFHKNKCFQSADSTRIMTASDVVYSLRRLIDPLTASPGAWVLQDKLDSIAPFQIIDSFRFIITLAKPHAQFLQVLSMPYCSVVPHEAVAYYKKDFHRNPVGTGAFQLKLWDPGSILFLEKNRIYHLHDEKGVRLPYIDIVKISLDENKKTELLAFQKKELSMISGIDASMISELFTDRGELHEAWQGRAQLYIQPFLNTEYIAILSDRPSRHRNSPLHHKSIRRAINSAIDRNSLALHIKNNLVYPANKGFTPYGMPHFDTNFQGYAYDPSRARTYIAEAGYGGQNKPRLTLHTNNNLVEMTEYISHQLSEVGFEVEIKLHPADMMMQLAAEGSIDFFRRSWMGDYPDAENFFACFYSKNDAPPNYTRFSNARFDRLYEDIKTEPNIAIRQKKYREMECILIQESPIVPIYYDKSIRLVQKNITGLQQNVLNTLDLKRVRIH